MKEATAPIENVQLVGYSTIFRHFLDLARRQNSVSRLPPYIYRAAAFFDSNFPASTADPDIFRVGVGIKEMTYIGVVGWVGGGFCRPTGFLQFSLCFSSLVCFNVLLSICKILPSIPESQCQPQFLDIGDKIPCYQWRIRAPSIRLVPIDHRGWCQTSTPLLPIVSPKLCQSLGSSLVPMSYMYWTSFHSDPLSMPDPHQHPISEQVIFSANG